MVIKLGATEIKKLFTFFLPAAVILFQWFSVGGINLSWLLYIVLAFFVFLRLGMFRKHLGLACVSVLVVSLPFLSYVFGIADSFPVSLYFSLATSLVVLLYICSMDSVEYGAFVKGVLASCVLFALWGIYEVFTGHYVLFSNANFYRPNWVGMHYPGVAFANVNDLVQYLVLLFPITGYLVLKRSKLLFAAISVAVLFVVFQADARLGMIAIIMTMLLAYSFGIITGGKSDRMSKLLLTGVCILLALWVYDIVTGTVSTIFNNFIVIDTSADYYTGREDIYAPLIKHILRHPLGGFGSAYVVTGSTPHNLMLYILSDYGWLPFIITISSIVKMVLFSYRKMKNSDEKLFWSLLFASLCLFVITSSISSCNEQRKAVWMFLGICIRNVYVAPCDGSEPNSSKRVRLTWGEE